LRLHRLHQLRLDDQNHPHKEAAHYLANAKIALAALSFQPKPQAAVANAGEKPSASSAKGTEE
jgi:hypothetical protein